MVHRKQVHIWYISNIFTHIIYILTDKVCKLCTFKYQIFTNIKTLNFFIYNILNEGKQPTILSFCLRLTLLQGSVYFIVRELVFPKSEDSVLRLHYKPLHGPDKV